MEWKPIETAPKDGSMIIVLDSGFVREAVWNDIIGRFTGSGGNVFNWCDDATHWMPLPAPPLKPISTETK
jgi:hypothetical protein